MKRWDLFWWKLAKGFLSGLSGSLATLAFVPGETSKYFYAVLGAALSSLIHGGANAIDQLKPKGEGRPSEE